MKIACGFGGGIGRQQMICGALTGAVMALGMRYGKSLDDPEEKKSETYNKTRELFEEFKKLNGSTICRELLNGLDMTNPDEHRKIEELKLFENSCEKYIVDSVKITENLMKK
jgi:C_GCAxxG_C_C family probable redox protein